MVMQAVILILLLQVAGWQRQARLHPSCLGKLTVVTVLLVVQ
jgi:hypothetical protein